jgi:hypothetical protein
LIFYLNFSASSVRLPLCGERRGGGYLRRRRRIRRKRRRWWWWWWRRVPSLRMEQQVCKAKLDIQSLHSFCC